jgi:hypothetical protein
MVYWFMTDMLMSCSYEYYVWGLALDGYRQMYSRVLRVGVVRSLTFYIEGNNAIMVTADRLGPLAWIVSVNQKLLVYCIYTQLHPPWFYEYPVFAQCRGAGGSSIGHGRFRSYLEPPGAVGAVYGSGCFHLSNASSASCRMTLNCRGSLTSRFASNNSRMLSAWGLQTSLRMHQSRDNLRLRR